MVVKSWLACQGRRRKTWFRVVNYFIISIVHVPNRYISILNIFVYCTLVFDPPIIPRASASASALMPSASTSCMSFCSMATRCSSVAFFMAFFAASTRARYALYLSSVPKILSHHRKEVEKLLVNAIWWKSWCSAPDQNGRILCNDQGKSEKLFKKPNQNYATWINWEIHHAP